MLWDLGIKCHNVCNLLSVIQKNTHLHRKKIRQNIKLINLGDSYMYYYFNFSTYFNIFKWEGWGKTLLSPPHILHLKLLPPLLYLFFSAKHFSKRLIYTQCLHFFSPVLSWTESNQIFIPVHKLAPDRVNNDHPVTKSKVISQFSSYAPHQQFLTQKINRKLLSTLTF